MKKKNLKIKIQIGDKSFDAPTNLSSQMQYVWADIQLIWLECFHNKIATWSGRKLFENKIKQYLKKLFKSNSKIFDEKKLSFEILTWGFNPVVETKYENINIFAYLQEYKIFPIKLNLFQKVKVWIKNRV